MFGTRSFPTFANYDLKRAELDEVYPIAAKATQKNLFIDDFVQSVESPEEAIIVLNNLQILLLKHDFDVKN